MLSPDHWLLLTAAGFGVGFLVGLTGVGAGSITTPLLITGFGVPPVVAVGTDLLFASITKASAAFRHHRLGNVDWGILKALALGSLPGALAVFAWLHFAQPDTVVLARGIRQALFFALIVSAVAISFYPLVRRVSGKALETDDRLSSRTFVTIALGLVLGALVALTSVGAGAIGVVALTALYPALTARRLIGTDIVHAIPLTLVCGMGHLGLGNIDMLILGTLLAGSVPGIAVGSRVTGMMPDWLLRVVLAGVLLVAAYMVLPR